MEYNKVYLGDSLEVIKTFPDACVDCVVTSPPYYALRDYGVDGQIGLEETPEAYIEKLVSLFREIRRVLKDDGTCWVNLGDSYWGGGWRNAAFNENSGDKQKGSKGTYCGESMPACKGVQNGYKPKDLIGIPWLFAFAMRADGWYLRQDIIWHKPNPMPESVTDRCTKSHEYIFLFSKKEKYYFDHEAIMEAVSDQQRKNYQSGARKYGINLDRNDNDLSERSKDWMPKMRYGSGTKTERTHEQGYAQKENGGHRDNSGGFDSEMAIKDGEFVRNKRDVWSVNVMPNKEAHFATYPQKLISPCISAGCRGGRSCVRPIHGKRNYRYRSPQVRA